MTLAGAGWVISHAHLSNSGSHTVEILLNITVSNRSTEGTSPIPSREECRA